MAVINGKEILFSPQLHVKSVSGCAEGAGENSLLFNETSENVAVAENSIAGGNGSVAGCKGYYFSAVDVENKKIYLSNTKVKPIVGAGKKDLNFETPQYNLEDKENLPYIGVTNGPPYLFTAKIVSVENNEVTYDGDIGFTSIANDESDDAYLFFVPDQPEIGVVSFVNTCFAFGKNVKAVGTGAFASGVDTIAYRYGHTEGVQTVANYASHAEGEKTEATGLYSHSEGLRTSASGRISHAEGVDTVASGQAAHAEGHTTTSNGAQAHAEGNRTIANGNASHAEGYNTKTYGIGSHAEGSGTVAGDENNDQKYAAHAEGVATKATNSGAHAEGWSTEASGSNSHAEGYLTKATGEGSHAEGRVTTASGYYSHAEGDYSRATGQYCHAEGRTCVAKGDCTHASGGYTIASGQYQMATGAYNEEDTDAHFIVGNGTSDKDRKNAFIVRKDGTAELQMQGVADNSVVILSHFNNVIAELNAKIAELEAKLNS